MATICTDLFLTKTKQTSVMSRISYKPGDNYDEVKPCNIKKNTPNQTEYLLALKESNVENRRVEVNELEDKHLEGQVIFIFRLCSVHF